MVFHRKDAEVAGCDRRSVPMLGSCRIEDFGIHALTGSEAISDQEKRRDSTRRREDTKNYRKKA